MEFASDNTAGAPQAVLEAMMRANEGFAPSYGADAWTERASALVAEIFERDVAVFFVATGTAANALALAAVIPPYGAVLCHEESHLHTDECGAPEFYSGGAKLVPVAGPAGKLGPEGVREALGGLHRGSPHSVQPAALSLTQATEAGTVYRPEEISALAALARTEGLVVHMDGARFANAVASLGCRPAELAWQAGVDILSFGGTKLGALNAEAVVFFDPMQAASMPFRRKRAGQLLSKHRYAAAQFVALLEDRLWLRLAAHANRMAGRLAEGLARSNAARLAAPAEANEIFPLLAPEAEARLRKVGARFHPWASPTLRRDADAEPEERLVRLVTSWATREEEVDAFLETLAGVEAAA